MEQTKKKIILIIEDEVPQLKILTDLFTREGFLVLQAKNGEAGLKMALEEQPDVVLLDILMPVMDGMTLLKKLRLENAWGKSVPIILLTNVNPESEKINQIIAESEPSYYLVKSDISLSELVEKVKEVLHESN